MHLHILAAMVEVWPSALFESSSQKHIHPEMLCGPSPTKKSGLSHTHTHAHPFTCAQTYSRLPETTTVNPTGESHNTVHQVSWPELQKETDGGEEKIMEREEEKLAARGSVMEQQVWEGTIRAERLRVKEAEKKTKIDCLE